MANRIVSVHAGIYEMGIYVIMLPSSGFSVAHSPSNQVHIALYKYVIFMFLKGSNCNIISYSYNYACHYNLYKA